MNKYEIIVAHGDNTETIVADYFEIDSDGVKFFKYTDDTKLESECVAAYIIPGEALKVIKVGTCSSEKCLEEIIEDFRDR